MSMMMQNFQKVYVVLNVFSEIKMFLYLHKEKNVLKNTGFSGAGSLFTCS
jgi:hypothetical protein